MTDAVDPKLRAVFAALLAPGCPHRPLAARDLTHLSAFAAGLTRRVYALIDRVLDLCDALPPEYTDVRACVAEELARMFTVPTPAPGDRP